MPDGSFGLIYTIHNDGVICGSAVHSEEQAEVPVRLRSPETTRKIKCPHIPPYTVSVRRWLLT